MDRFGPDNFSTLQMKGHVLHCAGAHLKVPCWLLVWNALLTKKLSMFLSRLNEISGGCEKIQPVWGSFWSNLKFFRIMDFTASVCTTNPQILIVICCIHLHIHHMSRILFLIILSFLDFVAFVVRTWFFLKIRENVPFLRQTWLSCFCCSSRPSSRSTNWSALSTTNVSEGE